MKHGCCTKGQGDVLERSTCAGLGIPLCDRHRLWPAARRDWGAEWLRQPGIAEPLILALALLPTRDHRRVGRKKFNARVKPAGDAFDETSGRRQREEPPARRRGESKL